jgi:hypothetical protein
LDQPYENDSASKNQGFLNRGAFFRKGRSSSGAFREDGATFIGKLSNYTFILKAR